MPLGHRGVEQRRKGGTFLESPGALEEHGRFSEEPVFDRPRVDILRKRIESSGLELREATRNPQICENFEVKARCLSTQASPAAIRAADDLAAADGLTRHSSPRLLQVHRLSAETGTPETHLHGGRDLKRCYGGIFSSLVDLTNCLHRGITLDHDCLGPLNWMTFA